MTDIMRTEFSPALDRWPLSPARRRAPHYLPGAAGTGSGAADRRGSAKAPAGPKCPLRHKAKPFAGGRRRQNGFSFPSNPTGGMSIFPPGRSPPAPGPSAGRGVTASSAPQLLGHAWLETRYRKTSHVPVLCHGHRHGNGLISHPTSAPCACLRGLPAQRLVWGSLNLPPPSAPGQRGPVSQNAE